MYAWFAKREWSHSCTPDHWFHLKPLNMGSMKTIFNMEVACAPLVAVKRSADVTNLPSAQYLLVPRVEPELSDYDRSRPNGMNSPKPTKKLLSANIVSGSKI